MMVALMKPKPEDIICDPAAGSAGFLVAAGEYLRENHADLFLVQGLKEHFNNHMFHGFDMDRTMLRIGAMNMMLHGVDNPNIEYRDSLNENNTDKDKYTLILANPPFKGSLDADSVSADLLRVTRTKRPSCCSLPSSCGCSRWADAVLPSCRTASYSATARRIKRFVRKLWTITNWKPLFRCRVVCLNPMQGFQRQS